jgi:hypothetical protein
VKHEIEFMKMNKVWESKVIPKEVRIVGCKWLYKTKHDSRENVEIYKARLVAKRVHRKKA